MTKRPINILIAEWIPGYNKGELAILFGMIETFRELESFQVTTFSFDPLSDAKRYPDSVRIIDVARDLYLGNHIDDGSRKSFIRSFIMSSLLHLFFILLWITIGERVTKLMRNPIWKSYTDADVIMICHNGVSCVLGFVLPFYPVIATIMARVMGKPCVIYGHGSANLRRKLWETIASFVLTNTSLVTIRDPITYDYLRKISGDSSRMYLTGDPAVLAKANDSQTGLIILENEEIPNHGNSIIGTTLTRDLILTIANESEIQKRYDIGTQLIASLFDRIVEDLDATLVFLPHSIEGYSERDDRRVAVSVREKMKHQSRAYLINTEYSPQDLKAVISHFDLFIGARIHSVVGALTVGVPSLTMCLPNDERALGIIGGSFGQQEWLCPMKPFDVERIMGHFLRLQSTSDQLRAELPHAYETARRKASRNGVLLRELLISNLR